MSSLTNVPIGSRAFRSPRSPFSGVFTEHQQPGRPWAGLERQAQNIHCPHRAHSHRAAFLGSEFQEFRFPFQEVLRLTLAQAGEFDDECHGMC